MLRCGYTWGCLRCREHEYALTLKECEIFSAVAVSDYIISDHLGANLVKSFDNTNHRELGESRHPRETVERSREVYELVSLYD